MLEHIQFHLNAWNITRLENYLLSDFHFWMAAWAKVSVCFYSFEALLK